MCGHCLKCFSCIGGGGGTVCGNEPLTYEGCAMQLVNQSLSYILDLVSWSSWGTGRDIHVKNLHTWCQKCCEYRAGFLSFCSNNFTSLGAFFSYFGKLEC